MKKDFETSFTGWSFILAAILLWAGWGFSNHHVEEYLVASDFEEIGKDVWYWIWMYRIHIFGWVTMGISMFAFTTLIMKGPYRVVLLPGIGMVIVGTFTLAIAAAFYYNYGAWGVGKTMGKTPEEVQTFMDGILFTNQYVTCFMRFGRIFSGVGLILLGAGFLKWKLLPTWLGAFTALLGLAALCLILFIPEYWEYYKPLFHIKVIWLIAMGGVLLTKGLDLSKAEN